MKAAWDWALPRETPTEERELAEFAADCGFDTLIVRDPTPALVEAGHERDLSVLAIVDGRPDEAFRRSDPDCLQRLLPVEEAMLDALSEYGADAYRQQAHRWYPPIHDREFLCFERDRSMEFLERRVSEALAVADGVAFDGFGFENQYACFCDRCDRLRERERAENDRREHEALARVSERTLVETTRELYDHAVSIDSTAVVANHVWPPFRPNPDYGHRLPLDYCSQTIAWFYKPDRSLERVAFEARERSRLAGHANEFVPFVGLTDDPSQRRSAERVERELEIALEHGGGVVLCTLALPKSDPAVRRAVRNVLR